ncbi:N-acetyltransferase esco2 [Entomophthora muscae]|uniref:N-acetyltransferase esco2 n=1 Tax=Entomophthora muscae TaxID=34485 RepID=A0ACC2SKV7_9FUNG|nr:N-acetyltransferase esco2 [Entomophthora muscae]
MMGPGEMDDFDAEKKSLPRAAITFRSRRRQSTLGTPLSAAKKSRTAGSDDDSSDAEPKVQKPSANKAKFWVQVPTKAGIQTSLEPASKPFFAHESPNFTKKSEQTFLNLGQKSLTTKCLDCGMSYSRGRIEDEQVHTIFHESVVNGIVLKKYKSEVLVKRINAPKFQAPASSNSKEFGSLRPFVSSNKAAIEGEVVVYHGGRLGTYDQRKIDEICSIVNQSLGSAEIEPSRLKNSKIYLFLSLKRKVLGCLIAEPIRRAYSMAPCSNSTSDDDDAWAADGEPRHAVAGVNRIWVLPKFRRRKVASHLLSALCASFVFGINNLPSSHVAFSQPTSAGRSVALSFNGGPGILVYSESDLAPVV